MHFPPCQEVRASLPLYFVAALSDYTLYLAEASGDADDERQHGMRTLAALLGREALSLIVLLFLIGSTVLLGSMHAVSTLALGLACGNLLRSAGAALTLWMQRSGRRGARTAATFSDYVFHCARITTLVVAWLKG